MVSKVKVEGGYPWKKKVLVDGKELPYVSRMVMEMEPDMVTRFDIELQGEPSIDVIGSVCLDFTPHTISVAAEVIKKQIKNDGDIRAGFKASIESALREYEGYPLNAMAEKVLERITGEENDSFWQ